MSILGTTSSPACRPELFSGAGVTNHSVMTISGTINRAFILTCMCVGTAGLSWQWCLEHSSSSLPVWAGGAILSLLAGIVMYFAPKSAPYLAPVYAISEGAFIGAISLFYAKAMEGTKIGGATGTGVVFASAGLTFAVLISMLLLYKGRIINATAKFKAVMCAVGCGIGLFSIGSLIAYFCGANMSWAYSGPLGLAIQIGIALYASFMLVLDFDYIEQGAATGAPRHLEWYAGYMLLATLVWIYLKFLRILSMLSKRD